MNIIHLIEANNGCGYFRASLPAMVLGEKEKIASYVADQQLVKDLSGFRTFENNFVQMMKDHSLPGNIDVLHCIRFHNWKPIIDYCKSKNIKVVYGTDDWMRWDKENPFHSLSKTNKVADKSIASAVGADRMVVTTKELKTLYKKYNSDIRVIPNYIRFADPQWNQRRKMGFTSNNLVIGYYGSMTHRHDLEIAIPAIERIMSEFPNVEFHYGAITEFGLEYNPATKKTIRKFMPNNPNVRAYRALSSNMDQSRIKFLNWKNIDEYAAVYSGFDIAVAPLRDTPMNRCKSNLKVIEPGGYGIPVVCSNIPTYADTIKHGETGFIAKTTEDWYEHLKTLVKYHPVRNRMSQAIQTDIRQKYDIDLHYRDWVDAFSF